MWNEFKAFVMRGSVVDMAIGVILGTAFGKIVTSLVSDILMPPLGLLLNEMDFSNLFINLSGTHYASLVQAKAAGAATINYGIFVSDVINFLIVALVMFCLIKPINRWKGGQGRGRAVHEVLSILSFSDSLEGCALCPVYSRLAFINASARENV